MNAETRRIAPAIATLCVVLSFLAGCSGHFPADTQGTLDRATGGTLSVGVSENAPWTQIDASGEITGREAELVEGYAESIDAEIEWTEGAESVLAEKMKSNELDLIIGGLTSDNPWSSKISSTRPYTTVQLDDGSTQKMVIGVRPGENALQVSLERFLADTEGEL